MTSPAAGWYPDPHEPLQMRWWDGGQWSDDTYERMEPIGGLPDGTTAGAAQQGAGQHHFGQQHGAAGVGPGPVTATEDGAQLAGWGRRLVAKIIDNAILLPVTLLLCWPTISSVLSHLLDVSREQQVSGTFDPFAVYDTRTLRDISVIGLVNLGLSLVYELTFLLWRAATPGKLALGLRVRRWRAGEALSATVVARRWLGLQGLGQVLGAPWTLADGLWPLWDRRRQALHDKLAGTCVVRTAPVTGTGTGAGAATGGTRHPSQGSRTTAP